MLPGRPRQEALPRRQRGLQQPGRRPRRARLQRGEPPAHRLRPPEHRAGRAGVAGRQRHGRRGLLGGPERPGRRLQELGGVGQRRPAARRGHLAELRRPVRGLRGQVAGRELPRGEAVRVPVQHRLMIRVLLQHGGKTRLAWCHC